MKAQHQFHLLEYDSALDMIKQPKHQHAVTQGIDEDQMRACLGKSLKTLESLTQ